MDSHLFGDHIHNLHDYTTTMASTISDFFFSAPPTSQLYAPSEVQRPGDFDSTVTTGSTENDSSSPLAYKDVDWRRLDGFEIPPPTNKRYRAQTSFVWAFGWRLFYRAESTEYWLCRLCHNGRAKPLTPFNPHGRGTSHAFVCTRTTSSAIDHLKEKHNIGKDGPIEAPPSARSTQASIDGFCEASAERNRSAIAFDRNVFMGLLLLLILNRTLPLSIVDAPEFRQLLVYLQPRLRNSIPSTRSLGRYIDVTYDSAQKHVELELQSAFSRVNLSFDLWTSPGRRLSLLGIVAHYLNDRYEPCAVLLALPRMIGAHTAANVAAQISTLLSHFSLRQRFGYAVTDNASENSACLAILGEELGIDAGARHVLCIGHVINLVAHEVLFGTDVEAFELELESNVIAEVVELATWRRKGPIGKLHNLIRYITHSTKRRDEFKAIQMQYLESQRELPEPQKKPLDLIRDNVTRWNSWYDAAERAVLLRSSIDEFVDAELLEYNHKMTRYASRLQQSNKAPPKTPSLLHDRLSSNDWSIIASYMAILKPCKVATMKLQGNVSTTARRGIAVKGGIWQVLPIFEDLLRGFEEARERHLPQESQTLQHAVENASPPSSPLNTQSTMARRTTRSSQIQANTRSSAPTDDSAGGIDRLPATKQTAETGATSSAKADGPFLTFEHHFSTNINAGWQKLRSYYERTDLTSIYRVAVFLHPRMKWLWFEKCWETKPTWIKDARTAVNDLWMGYKDDGLGPTPTAMTAPQLDDDEDWLNAPDTTVVDQLWQYEHEPRPQMLTRESPIPYWISKITVWPQLARMALDVFSTPPMSDEPERVFSISGHLLSPRRRQLSGESVEQLLCLRSWSKSGIIKLDEGLLQQAMAEAGIVDDEVITSNKDDSIYLDNDHTNDE
jgi:hypothetical protein